jgi:large subunit ribosomal protein L23
MSNIQIINPRVTEKASNLVQQGVYAFNVFPSANKTEIKKAIFTLYKVKPLKIHILSVPKKSISVKGKKGIKSGPTKKALVYLKKGDVIENL